MLLPALRGDKYKNDLVLVYGGQEVALWGNYFVFVSFQEKTKQTTGLAISTVGQIQTAKTKHPEHLKECVYLGIVTSYSGTQNSLCF